MIEAGSQHALCRRNATPLLGALVCAEEHPARGSAKQMSSRARPFTLILRLRRQGAPIAAHTRYISLIPKTMKHTLSSMRGPSIAWGPAEFARATPGCRGGATAAVLTPVPDGTILREDR